MPEFSDILIIIIGLATAGIFNYLGTEKLYRFYFGIIMGFLLFLVFNLQIKLFEISGGISGGWEEFLVSNKETVLGFFSLMIPIFGGLFTFLDSDLKSNKLFSLLFGFFLPLFLLGIFGYILINSSIELDFLKNMFSIFETSYIFDLLQKAPKLIFGILIIIIFWKYIFAFILAILHHFAKLIIAEIKEIKEKREEEKKSD